MFCSLCHNPMAKYIQLPCNHHLCISCLPNVNTSSQQDAFYYQCEICLQTHLINLSQQVFQPQKERKRILHNSRINNNSINYYSESIFCWSCQQAITLNQYIKGPHHEHKVQTYNQAMPQIKNLMLEQLQKALILKQYLQQNKILLENNLLKRDYQFLLGKVNDFFEKQIQIVQKKRIKILDQIEVSFLKLDSQMKRNAQELNPLLKNVQNLEFRISSFLNDTAPLSEINPINQVISKLDFCLINVSKHSLQEFQLPEFIVKSNVKDAIDLSCQIFRKKLKASNELQIKTMMQSRMKFVIECQKLGRQQTNKFESNSGVQKTNMAPKRVKEENRKVRLVEKLKGKMKYTSSLSLTTII